MLDAGRLKARMAEVGVSQSELGRRIGVSQSAIYHLARGGAQGSKHLHKIARELATTVAYLTGETDDPDSDAPDDGVLSSGARELLAAFDQLPSRDKRALIQIATSLATANNDRGQR